jgi:signal transduction histidine kinase
MIPEVLSSQQLEYLKDAQTDLVMDSKEVLDSSFISLLDSIERKQLSQVISERRCAAGEVIMREGDIGDALYMIWAGRVVAFNGDLESPKILSYNGAGEIIGEMALLENRPRYATVVALGDLRLLKIKRDDFLNLIKNDPIVGMSITESLNRRLRLSDQARTRGITSEWRLIKQVNALEEEKNDLLDLQQLRQETSDLIVHDLRNPLSNVSLTIKMMEMMLPEEVANDNQQLLEIAKSGCDRMLRLVESLLEVSRMEEGLSALALTQVDFRELIEEIAKSYLIPNYRDIQLHVNLAETIPVIKADREKIERVLVNLVDNALKYTRDGEKIGIDVQVQDDELVVSIIDSGPGIPSKDRERIFERFSQVGNGKKGRRGFGLGLTFCRLVVEAHKGKIWVEPGENGKGSKFIFVLPLMSEVVETEDLQPSEVEIQPKSSTSVTILPQPIIS